MVYDSPRSRRREATLDRIVDAALALVHREGLAGLTMQRLAKAVDYTPGALYRYFPSKGALVAELNRRVLERTREAVAAAQQALPDLGEPDLQLARLLATSGSLLSEARARPGAFAVVAATMGDPTRLVTTEEAVHLPVLASFLASVAADLEAAATAGVLTPGPSEARALRWVFALVGILQLNKLASVDPRLDPWPLAEGLTADLLRGWGASEDALQRATHALKESP